VTAEAAWILLASVVSHLSPRQELLVYARSQHHRIVSDAAAQSSMATSLEPELHDVVRCSIHPELNSAMFFDAGHFIWRVATWALIPDGGREDAGLLTEGSREGVAIG